MARKEKIDNAVLKRFARQETRRKQDFRAKRRYYLIVCEGTKTEPNYFKGLKMALPPGVIEVPDFHVEGVGHDPLTIVSEALGLKASLEKSSGRFFDEVWAVFDRDDFPPERFNNAIAKGMEIGVECAWTNEAFELWYLLHFQLFRNGMSRYDYKALIERELSASIGASYRYQKNSENIYALLSQYGSQEQAILWAEKLEIVFAERTDYANHNPCTKVHTLVTKLVYPDKKEDETMTDYLQQRREGMRK